MTLTESYTKMILAHLSHYNEIYSLHEIVIALVSAIYFSISFIFFIYVFFFALLFNYRKLILKKIRANYKNDEKHKHLYIETTSCKWS